jgi:hypothetical protein
MAPRASRMPAYSLTFFASKLAPAGGGIQEHITITRKKNN